MWIEFILKDVDKTLICHVNGIVLNHICEAYNRRDLETQQNNCNIIETLHQHEVSTPLGQRPVHGVRWHYWKKHSTYNVGTV